MLSIVKGGVESLRQLDTSFRLLGRFLVNGLLASALVPSSARVRLFRLLGMRLRTNILLGPSVSIRTPEIEVGEESSINARCYFDNRGGVKIGNRVGVGIDVAFITSRHDFSDPNRRAGVGGWDGIVVEDGCWIGSRATILGGVHIRHGCVIAAGSVVTKSTEPDGLYGGAPARRIRDI